MTREYRRELKTLDRAERAATKPLRERIKTAKKWISFARRDGLAWGRILAREQKLAEKAVAKLRARRAILEGRLS